MKHEKTSFTDQEITLDDNEFHECDFKNCVLIYSGMTPPTLDSCSFTGVKWSFIGAAANTVVFMKALYHGCGEGGRILIEETFDGLKKNQVPSDIRFH